MDKDDELKIEGWRAVKYYREFEAPKVIQWVIKYSGGLITDERRAVYVLLAMVMIAVVISFVIWPRSRESELSPEEVSKYQQILKTIQPR